MSQRNGCRPDGTEQYRSIGARIRNADTRGSKHGVGVGIIDTGLACDVVAYQEFRGDEVAIWPVPSSSGHGTRIATIVRALCPDSQLFDARAFEQIGVSTTARVAAALDWLVEQCVPVVNMSFGLRDDRQVLAAAVMRATDAGLLLVASAPAAGPAVYPAGYAPVIAVTGDARCNAGEYTDFGRVLNYRPDSRPGYSPGCQADSQARSGLHFGAAVGDMGHRAHQAGAGASLAAAHVSGALAQSLVEGCSSSEAILKLRERCRYRGREQRC